MFGEKSQPKFEGEGKLLRDYVHTVNGGVEVSLPYRCKPALFHIPRGKKYFIFENHILGEFKINYK